MIYQKRNDMTTFNSNTAAKKKVEELANTNLVNYTNEGFEVLFTSDNSKEEVKAVAEKLQSVFSNVVIKGKKVKYILINRISQNVQNFRVTEVAY